MQAREALQQRIDEPVARDCVVFGDRIGRFAGGRIGSGKPQLRHRGKSAAASFRNGAQSLRALVGLASGQRLDGRQIARARRFGRGLLPVLDELVRADSENQRYCGAQDVAAILLPQLVEPLALQFLVDFLVECLIGAWRGGPALATGQRRREPGGFAFSRLHHCGVVPGRSVVTRRGGFRHLLA